MSYPNLGTDLYTILYARVCCQGNREVKQTGVNCQEPEAVKEDWTGNG